MVKGASDVGQRVRKFNLPQGLRLLIIEAPYYSDIAGILIANAKQALQLNTCGFETVSVQGALEIPQALAAAVDAHLFETDKTHYHGVVVLGCIIRGQTSHYDIVCKNTNYWLMKIAIKHSIPLGNGILTVDTYDQAYDRAVGMNGSPKGEEAVQACLGLIELKKKFIEMKK